MTEIKRCPFCGELPVVCLKHGDMHNVSCETVDCCGENDLWWETEQEAIEAWNQRYETTCDLYVKGNMYHCDKCDYPADPNESFCAMCGSKIEFSGETKCKVIEE